MRNKNKTLLIFVKILRNIIRDTAVMLHNISVISQVQITAGAFMVS